MTLQATALQEVLPSPSDGTQPTALHQQRHVDPKGNTDSIKIPSAESTI